MEFGITIPLQRHLRRPRPAYGEVEDAFFCWEAHRVVLGGVDVLLLANASNRFAAFATMGSAEWRTWEDVALASIRAALASAGFDERVIDAYVFFGGAPEITRTHGRRPVAFLNVLVEKLLLPLAEILDTREAFPCALCRIANEQLHCKAAGFEGLGFPADRFEADLRRVGINASAEGAPARERALVVRATPIPPASSR